MNKLRLNRYKFNLRFTSDSVLPPFAGNTIRGAFGQSLLENFPDIYEKIFKIEGANSHPNPYVISVPYPSQGSYKIGDTLDFTITLFGTACAYEKDILLAVRLMCNGKLSGAKVVGWEQEYDREWSDVGAGSIPQTEALKLDFLTPTEILSGKEPIAELDFSMFIDSLLGRSANIIGHYTEGEFVVPYNLIANKPNIKAEYELKHINFQTSGQPIYSFIGSICYFGNITRYLPYIDLGSQIHIGKKTTRSCGEYSFEI